MNKFFNLFKKSSPATSRSKRSPEASGVRRALPVSFPLGMAIIVGCVVGLGLLLWFATTAHSGSDYEEVPISKILTMADQHLIAQATITGDEIQVITTKDGKKYEATKEDQQAVTDRLTKRSEERRVGKECRSRWS